MSASEVYHCEDYTTDGSLVRGFPGEALNGDTIPLPVPAEIAAERAALAATPSRRRHIYFLAALSRDPDQARAFTVFLIERFGSTHLGSKTMHRLGTNREREYAGADFEAVCQEMRFFPLGSAEEVDSEIRSLEGCIFNCELDRLRRSLDEGGESRADREARVNRVRGYECQIARLKESLLPERRRAAAAVFIDECARR